MRRPLDVCDPCFNHKIVIWRHFLSPVPVVPSLKDHELGINVEEQLVIQWMCGATASDTALQLLFCMCTRSWNLPGCICLNNDPNCTNLCKIANQFKPVKLARACSSANREDEDEALDGTLPGVVSMYKCQHPLSYSQQQQQSSSRFYFQQNTTMQQ